MASGGRSGGSNRGKSHVRDDYEQHSYDPNNFVDEFNPFFGAEEEHMAPVEEDEPTAEEEHLNTQESISQPPTAAATGKKSFIWDHFESIPRFDIGPDRYELQCIHCKPKEQKYQYRTGQGYGSMTRHVKQIHPDKMKKKASTSASHQTQISAYGTNHPPFHYSDKVYKEKLGRYVCCRRQPFSFGEQPELVDLFQTSLNPQAKRVPRNSLKRVIKDIYKKEKNELRDMFASFNGHVHICSDIWSDHWLTNSYMGITCHWIDEEWNIQKRILAFRVFADKHTAHNIAILITHILEEYFLINKIFSIGFDNASSNTASLPDLIEVCKPSFGGKFFHIRCTCHVLNLCVQSGLQSLNILIDPIKKAVQFLWRHPQKMKEWSKFCKLNGFKSRKFSKDVPTRWNSTYKLLEETYEYRDLLVAFISHNARPDDNICLYSSGWDDCKKVLEILASFNSATLTLSGVYYSTSHLFFIEAINIAGMFDIDRNNALLDAAVQIMREKWLAYYKDIPMIYLIAFVFYPHNKIEGLCDYLTYYYECLHIMEEMDIPQIAVKVKRQIIEIYNEYANRCGVSTSTSNSLVPSNDFNFVPSSSNISLKGYEFRLKREKKQKRVGGGSVTELDSYLATLFEFNQSEQNFDILDWWKKHALHYPILSLIAKQILATPCSTVAVEQAFSAGGNILDETRSRLTPDSLEMQVCVDDWTKAQYRQQEIDKKENEFFSEDEDTTTGPGSDD